MKAILVVAFLAPILGAITLHQGAIAANLVANGGFESGYYDDWSLITGGPGNDLLITNDAHSGLQAASFAATRHIDDIIYQQLPTVPGSAYEIHFWLSNINPDSNGQDNHFVASWDGAPIFSLTNAPFFGYTEYSFTEIASTSLTELRFAGANNPAATNLDDVSVALVTPEPSSFVLAALGLIGLVVWKRRKR
jgi:hypothetical protein